MGHKPNASNQGFTLIELSIVLVVVGLIVGGVLVGLDLVKAAELRATISQIEKCNSAVNTFRSKYNSIPGDMAQINAGAFGLLQLTDAAITGEGDNNGFIEGAAAGVTDPVGETLVFWRHLSDASLIDGSYGNSGNSAIDVTTGLVGGAVSSVGQSLPPTKLMPVNYFVVYSAGGFNYFQLLPVTSITTAPAYTFGTSGISPIQAYNVDVKLDDGMPNTGSVMAKGIGAVNAAASFTAASTAIKCLMTGASSTDPTDTYNRVTATGGNDMSCSVQFRFN